MGNKLAWRQSGNKNSEYTLVFLHGSAMTKEGMAPLVDKFQKYNCISLDLTAHGESKGDLPESISDIAGDVECTVEFLKETKVVNEKIILLGYSMGGAVLCDIALRGNMKPEGLVLLSSGADLKHYTPAVESLKDIAAEQFQLNDIVDFLFGSLAGEKQREEIKSLILETASGDKVGYNDLMLSNSYDCMERAKDIKCRTLLVHGCGDKIVLPSGAVETWKRIEGSQLLMVPYGGHALIYEYTGEVYENINRFLQKL